MASNVSNEGARMAKALGLINSVKPMSGTELIAGDAPREFILLCGKDGVGKSCAIVSLARWVEIMAPDAQFFVIDTENKFRTALRSFGADAPSNIIYYKTDDMNQVTWAVDQIINQHRPGDWLAMESMSRIWERSQDLGYKAVSGYTKIEYLERRAAQSGKQAPVVPKPDDFWSVVKGAHDGACMDLLSQSETLNRIISTTVSRPPKEGGFIKENVTRRDARVELGIDAGLDGAPRLPYYVETLCMMELRAGQISCRVLRDNLSHREDSRVEFDVAGRKDWAPTFWSECR